MSVKAFEIRFSKFYPNYVSTLKTLSQHFNKVTPKHGVEKVELFTNAELGCPNYKEPNEECSEWTVCRECLDRPENGGCPTHINHQKKIYKKLSSGSLDYSNFNEVLEDLNEYFDPDQDYEEYYYIEAFLIGLARSIGIDISDNIQVKTSTK